MGLSNKLSQYNDIALVLNAVLESDKPGTYTMASPAQATRWRQRAYYFRKLLTDQSTTGRTPYDAMVLRTDGPAVTISFDPPPAGQLTIDGKAIDTSTITMPMGLPLLLPDDEIKEAAERLGLETET